MALPPAALCWGTVHVITEILDKHPHGRRQGAVTWKRQLVNQKDEVVQEGTFQTLVAHGPRVKHKIGKLNTESESDKGLRVASA